MSRRRLNRALGATSLELKCLFLFGAFLLVVVTISFSMYWFVTGKLAKQQNPNTGELLADQAMLILHWQELETDLEGKVGWIDELELPKNLTVHDFEARFIHPYANVPTRPEELEETDGKFHFKLGPPEDEFEKELLQTFLHAPQDNLDNVEAVKWKDRVVLDGDEYQYYQAVRADRTCVRTCHAFASPGFNPRDVMIGGAMLGEDVDYLEEGDLMAIVQVTIDNKPTRDLIAWTWNTLLAVAIITGFLAMIAFYITIRYIVVRPVRHLHEVADSISRGNIALRAEIRTGDEFEGLAFAFNRMLRHLVTIQDELRQTNTQLDGKVDQLAQANMQLYEMNRIKSDFLATMSHELRTPLNSILGFSDVLGGIDALDEKQQRYVQNIQKSGRLLLEMINNILDLAKIESGKMDVRLVEFDIDSIVTTQCDMARPLTEKRNIDLDIEIQPDLPAMCQDQGRVHQILNNLLSNAIKFTPEGGRIKVAAERNGRGELLLKVTDTGVGIAAEDQQTIFEKFRQGGTAMPGGDAITREYSGTGLGLSIVKELCRLLNGEVSVQSELGTGSTFTVRLPWELTEPTHESPLVTRFKEFGRPHLDPTGSTPPEPLSAGIVPQRRTDG